MVKGAIISVLSTFDENGNYDAGCQKKFVDFLISKGVGGIWVLGTAGQGPLLPFEDRKLISKTVIDAVAGRVPVIAHCSAANTRETLDLVRDAVANGADIIAALPPIYSRLDLEAYKIFYKEVRGAAGKLPVLLYNNPLAQGRALTVNELMELHELGYIDGVTDSSRDLGSVYKLLDYKDSFTCIIADTKLCMAGMMYGCPALSSAIGNAIPEIFIEMCRAIEKGDYKKAIELELKAFKISESLRSPEIGAIHYAVKARGLDAGYPRGPIRLPNDDEKRMIEKAMCQFR